MSNYDKSNKSNVSIDVEVQKLFNKKNGVSKADFQMLRNKYGDEDVVDRIQKKYVEIYTNVSKRAKKFAQLIREKYASSNYPFHILLEKAYKYKVKHSLSDAEFTEFQRIYENELVGIKSLDVVSPDTNITKLLGNVGFDTNSGFNSKLNETDFKMLQETLKLYSTSKPLHAQVLLQSMQYEDSSIEALTGTYDSKVHIVSNHVHPVVAALFIPKVEVLELHFLHSNIARIVSNRYNKEPFSNIADIKLYDSLRTDPNDVVCNQSSTTTDLYNRALLQNQLWACVLSLRNGQYYNASFRDFIHTIDICKLNKQDTPDLIYGRYDGIVLRRILSAFSFRPTIVSTAPIYSVFNLNPYQINAKPTVRHIAMINLKIPFAFDDKDAPTINLRESLNQTQYVQESNGTFVPKHTSLIYSNGVLFFYVDRRANVIKIDNGLLPYNMSSIPIASSGFERLNNRTIAFDPEISIREDKYVLRSVVVSEINNQNPAELLVVGSSAIFTLPPDSKYNRSVTEYFKYDPYSVIKNESANTTTTQYGPIQVIPGTPLYNNSNCSFTEIAQERGVIFMYELVEKNIGSEIQF
jgi:hypothetical protein